MLRQLLIFFLIVISTNCLKAQAPYNGTIFFDPDIITSEDPSAILSTTYIGQDVVVMFDRRVNDWVTVNAFLFDVVWDDGLTSVAQVNSEFGSVVNATIEAEKYAFLIGQLPTALRVDVDEIWIHQGTELFGGGNNSILIHTGQTVLYENDGILEETLIHEASHTSLDATHAASNGWISAQNLDDEFISTYAEANPTTEDIAESFLTWLAVRYRADVISSQDYNTITQTIPNRLSYFDTIGFDLYPFDSALSVENFESEDLRVYPNPSSTYIQIETNGLIVQDIKLYTILGQDYTSYIRLEDTKIDISNLSVGVYFLKLNGKTHKIIKN